MIQRQPSSRISLLISDVDGTLVTKEKTLTAGTWDAIRSLRRAGLGFTVVSSRPPRGLSALLPALALDLPYGGFNGGAIIDPITRRLLEQQRLPEEVARQTLAFLAAQNVSTWVFNGAEWLVQDRAGPYVAHEERTFGFEPRQVDLFTGAMLLNVGKIVGVSEDFDRLASCEVDLQRRLMGSASVLRSQRYYLDVTHPEATKGHFLRALAGRFALPQHEIAVIGDMANDVSMFREAGFSIAMGNATEPVKAEADAVTASNGEDGFAEAVARFILPRAATRPLGSRVAP
jgi:Cof subfamily protein (haloacid dehalogenase superfamily)